MSLKFGTDGVRGPADELTDELVAALGQAAASVFGTGRFVIGRDTRASGPRLAAALAAGIVAGGGGVESLGVVPTPLVALVAAQDGCAGAMVSASHNTWSDNGIKLFAPGGTKLSDAVEAELEAKLAAVLADGAIDLGGVALAAAAAAAGEGDPFRVADASAIKRYAAAVAGSLDGRRLDGVSVVIDCANGSASLVAAVVLRSLGAEVAVLHAEPDGRNINAACGSTYPADLQAAVVAVGAQVGLAFDGDADRVLAVDEHGTLVDGDELIAICTLDRHARGVLVDDAVVVTVMTNLGFRQSMERHGIEVVETAVGDRYVLEALAERKLSIGGEQSGHIIFPALATTGDGLLSGVQVLDVLVRSGLTLSALAAAAMTRLPQVLHNVRVAERRPDVADLLADAIAAEEAVLAGTGRILVRPSGTEPLIRVMVEAPDADQAEAIAARLAAAAVTACGPA